MSPLLVGLGAGIGAMLRFALATYVDRPDVPLGTWLANVSGSFVLGLLSGLAVGPDALLLLGVGFCGGFTTYSSFAVQAHEHGPLLGSSYVVATLVCALAACAAGFALGAVLV
ncbi:MAG: CrcB family protein [Nocardioides sp.]|nr:CrcB family protein [Nocardioides sp.]